MHGHCHLIRRSILTELLCIIIQCTACHTFSVFMKYLIFFHPWSTPHPIPGNPEQPKVYARKKRNTPENPINSKSMLGKLGVFRSFLGFPGFSGLFRFFGVSRVFWIVFRIFQNQEGVVAKNLFLGVGVTGIIKSTFNKIDESVTRICR